MSSQSRPRSSAVSSAPSPRGFLRRHAGKFAASVLITGAIVYVVRKGGLKFLPEGRDFSGVRWWAIALYLVPFLGMSWFRSVRWRFLLQPLADIPRRRIFAVSCIGFAAILILPFRIGEIVRPYLMRTRPSERREGSRSITMTAATSSIVAERVIDGLYVSIVLALTLLFVPTVHPLPDKVVGLPISVQQVRMSGYAMLGLFCAAFVNIAVFYFARSWAHRTTLRVVGKVSRRLAEKLAGLCEKLADGLHVFGRSKDAIGFFVETSVYWGLNAIGMWLLAWGCGVVHSDGSPPTLGEACALMGMLSCAILIPGPPGMLGIFQAGIYAGMTMYYSTSVVVGPGAAYVFVMYALQVLMQLTLGLGGLWYEGGRRGLRGGLHALEEAEGIVPAPADAG